ncbi:biotin-dependent carboxyltransferase family protein [Aquimarina sp. AU474]|uniref:5-oxoprolinase subunit C family protein n=1 Tax=Aquimarina sp. AU474 TaxID=2108529 RepID=UPI000D6867D5|nr:biotin-dependent carboxyltransferase family protein [Aquimarina sp. AU474]
MKGKVEIIKPGLFTTIQDKGRFGFSKYGIPKSGPMDEVAFDFANSLLGNQENCACIEWTLQAPILKFNEPTLICLTGSLVDAFLNGEKVEMYRQVKIVKNDILTINFCKNKLYGYVGIENGFQSDVVLKSRSFYPAVTPKSTLKKGDILPYLTSRNTNDQFSSLVKSSHKNITNHIEVYQGIEFDLLSNSQKEYLLETEFTISSKRNRMAIQLKEELSNTLPSIITAPVLPGTVQLTPSGKLIVLMRDCQTTGGYPRVLQLSSSAINQIAQKRTNQKVKFRLIDL